MRLEQKQCRPMMRYRSFVIVCIIAVGLLQPEIGFAQSESPLPELNTIVVAYAEAMQIDYAEAERRLTLQHEMSLVAQVIAEDEAYFATWMQHTPTFGFFVAFTTADGNERIRPYLEDVPWGDLVTVQQSDITRDELTEMRHQVVEEARKTGITFGSGLNYQTGQVRLYTEQPDELRERLAGNDEIASIIERIEFIQEGSAAPANPDYAHVLYRPLFH
jgi:hypothetical protein